MNNPDATKKAVIYCRVSTKEQVEEGNSLVTQEKNCREYAAKNNFEVSAVFIEMGESAKTAERHELKKLMAFCTTKKNAIQAVIAYKVDRISRNNADYSQIRLALRRYGVEIKSTTEYFEDNPAGRFMENILANVAQFDNDVRAERSLGGMRDAVREGRYVWQASPGYSNVKVDGKSTIAPNEQAPIITRAFEEVAKNRYTVERVRMMANNEALLSRSGKKLSKNCFYRLLRNEVYTGWISMFGERHRGAFEAIVPESTFNQVQFILSGKRIKQETPGTKYKDFPLRKFIKHPTGKLITGCWSQGRQKKYPYYLLHSPRLIIRQERLHEIFKNYVNEFKIDIEYFDRLKAWVESCYKSKKASREIDNSKVSHKIEDLKKRQSLLIEKNINGIISDSLCKEQLQILDSDLYTAKELLATSSHIKNIQGKSLAVIRDFLTNPGKVWDKVDFDLKQKLQWFYFPQGLIFDGEKLQTTKICKIFKLVEQFLAEKSRLVNHPNHKSNAAKLQIIPPFENTVADLTLNDDLEDLLWVSLGDEIEYIENMFQNRGDTAVTSARYKKE